MRWAVGVQTDPVTLVTGKLEGALEKALNSIDPENKVTFPRKPTDVGELITELLKARGEIELAQI